MLGSGEFAKQGLQGQLLTLQPTHITHLIMSKTQEAL